MKTSTVIFAMGAFCLAAASPKAPEVPAKPLDVHILPIDTNTETEFHILPISENSGNNELHILPHKEKSDINGPDDPKPQPTREAVRFLPGLTSISANAPNNQTSLTFTNLGGLLSSLFG